MYQRGMGKLVGQLFLAAIIPVLGGCIIPVSGNYYKPSSNVGKVIPTYPAQFEGPPSLLLVDRGLGVLYLRASRVGKSSIVLLGYVNQHSSSPVVNLADVKLELPPQYEDSLSTSYTIKTEKFLWQPVGIAGCKCIKRFSSGSVRILSGFVRVDSFGVWSPVPDRRSPHQSVYQLVQIIISLSVKNFSVVVPPMTIGRRHYSEFKVAFTWSHGTWIGSIP